MKILQAARKKLYGIKKNFLMRFTVKGQRKCVLPNRLYVPKYYKLRMGRTMDLKNPKEFSEKLNWYKVYYHDPLFTLCADKYRMREYVKTILGEGYTVPLLGKWDKPEDIDFDKLPDKFVLKTNHSSSGLVFCYAKTDLDRDICKQQLNKQLKIDYYRRGREWAYKNIKRCVIAEEFIETGDDELIDYRFFCFNGEPKFIYVTNEKTDAKHGKLTCFDMEFNKLPFLLKGCEEAGKIPIKPKNFEQMKEVAKKLSGYGDGGIPFVRVDMYSVQGKIYIGELTFYPTNGMENLEPKEWNKIIGDYFLLPKKNGWKKQSGRDNKWIKKLIKKS